MPTLPDESLSELPDVELLERSSFELDEGTTVEEPVQRGPVVGTKALGAVAVGLIVLAFAIISQPGVEESVDESATAQTTAPSTTTTTTPPPPSTDAAGRRLQPIPVFQGNLPEELPGVISGFDDRGSVLLIERSRPRPVESQLGAVPTDGNPTIQLGLLGGPVEGFDNELFILGSQVIVETDQALLRQTFDLRRLVPDGVGGVLVVEESGPVMIASLLPLGDRQNGTTGIGWRLPSAGLDVLGFWRDELLVHRAASTWLLSTDGGERPVAEGEVLTYDGRHLTRLECTAAAPGQCELIVGTPDDPEIHRVLLPTVVEQVPVEHWGPTVAVSPDGSQLALSAQNGGLPLPLLIDLTTGESRQLADGMNASSPVVWSPDGQWLAYLYTNDVMVWSLDADRSWRVAVNRDLQTLLWR